MDKLSEKENFIELRAQGKSYDSIAKVLGRTKKTLITWSKELKVEVNNAKIIEMDSLHEKYLLSKKARYERFGNTLNLLNQELEKRDLSSLSTKELIDLILKTNSSLFKEFEELKFSSEKDYSFTQYENWSA
jgi:transposase